MSPDHVLLFSAITTFIMPINFEIRRIYPTIRPANIRARVLFLEYDFSVKGEVWARYANENLIDNPVNIREL